MNYIQKRVADRKLICARCQAVGRAFMNLDSCNEIVIEKARAEPGTHDADTLSQWRGILADCEKELTGEIRPESWDIKRGETCMYVAMSGAHYLHLACTEKYIEDVRRALATP